jgi:hypothetical protein
MRKASQPKLRYPHRAAAPWFRVLLGEMRRSDLAEIFAKTHNRRRSRHGRREIIQLILIILGSIIAVIAGLYGGITSSHHHER